MEDVDTAAKFKKLIEEYEAKLKQQEEAYKKEREEYEAKFKEQEEAYKKEREEYEAKFKEQEEMIIRSNIKSKIYNKEIISYTQLLDEINKGNFRVTNDKMKKVINTENFIRERSSISSTSMSNVIQMRKFNRKQVAETEDKMNVILLNIPLEEFVRERYNELSDFSNIFNEATADLEKIREYLLWLEQNGHSFDEKFTQQVFTIFCSGLLGRVDDSFEVFAINGIELYADISVKTDAGVSVNKRLVGMSDVAIGLNTTDGFGLDEIVAPRTALVEIKKSFGTLSTYRSKIGNATNQQLAQLFALSKMRETLKLDVLLDKSVLCDLFFSRIALRVKNDDKVLFPITTLYEKASDFVACILFLIADVSMSDVLPFINLDIHVDNSDDEKEEADINVDDNDEQPSNLLVHAKINRIKSKKGRSNDGKKHESRRRPLGMRNENILLMDDDDNDDDKAKERQLQNLQYIAEWDACRLGRPYLSSANLRCRDRVI